MYNKRVWLNKECSPSTGSVVAYHGLSAYAKDKGTGRLETLLEISDCHSKVHIHKTHLDTNEDFINKMVKLRDTINGFIQYLVESDGSCGDVEGKNQTRVIASQRKLIEEMMYWWDDDYKLCEIPGTLKEKIDIIVGK